MYFYILDDNNTVVNAISLDEGTDPSAFSAIADDRVFDIGDTWTPQLTESQLLGREITAMELESIAQGQKQTALELDLLEQGQYITDMELEGLKHV
ncbi:hypothetical protein LKD74_13445 [Intestinimonas sp. CLA-AA-H199]|nr:hypothetical protein [Intestinimonas aquisgranensis]